VNLGRDRLNPPTSHARLSATLQDSSAAVHQYRASPPAAENEATSAHTPATMERGPRVRSTCFAPCHCALRRPTLAFDSFDPVGRVLGSGGRSLHTMDFTPCAPGMRPMDHARANTTLSVHPAAPLVALHFAAVDNKQLLIGMQVCAPASRRLAREPAPSNRSPGGDPSSPRHDDAPIRRCPFAGTTRRR